MSLCECGCGAVTTVYHGKDRRFIDGHQRRLPVVQGYLVRGTSGKDAKFVHRMRAEAALGKPLPPKAIVHHADGSRRADAPLVICQDQAYHKLLHSRADVLKRGGNPNTQRWCGGCRQLRLNGEFGVSRGNGRADMRGHRCLACCTATASRYRATAKQSGKYRQWRDALNARRRARYAEGLPR